jgi:hypothetical protein
VTKESRTVSSCFCCFCVFLLIQTGKNCEKNNVECEGYPTKTPWQSGKEKGKPDATKVCICQHGSAFSLTTQRVIELPSIITGIDSPSDRMFFDHYISRLSFLFTAEGKENNAFKDILLPAAMDHPGLMHSILRLSSRHIDYRSPIGISFLEANPDESIKSLEQRSEYHRVEALNALVKLDLKSEDDRSEAVVPVALGQTLCIVLETLADTTPNGEHRLHLEHYLRIKNHHRPQDSPLLKLIDEFFLHHHYLDQLILLPSCSNADSSSAEWDLLSKSVSLDEGRLLGVSDGLFLFMSSITKIRNSIRENKRNGVDPPVTAPCIREASDICTEIQQWKIPIGDSRSLAGRLYHQMIWVYLWQTIYPPKPTDWKIRPELTKAVDDGISLLQQFPAHDLGQTFLLPPAFILGCAAYESHQRVAIRRAILAVKEYMGYKNSDSAQKLLDEVWRLMDAKDPRSWDWNTIASEMELDFLLT